MINLDELANLSPEQIVETPAKQWDIFELADLINGFEQAGDRERVVALTTLFLRSPDYSNDWDYEPFFREQIQNLITLDRQEEALAWAYAYVAFGARWFQTGSTLHHQQELAETYLRAGDLNTGLAIFARLLRRDPTNVWTPNILALGLQSLNLPGLIVEIMTRGQEILPLASDDEQSDLEEQFRDFLEKARSEAKAGPDSLDAIEPDVLAELRAALQIDPTLPVDRKSYPALLDRLTQDDIPAVGGPDPELAALYESILGQAKLLADELIRMAFDENLSGTPAPDHAVELLRRINDEGTAALAELNEWLRRADPGWQDLLLERFGVFWPYTTDELMRWCEDLSVAEGIRWNAANGLVERANDFPEERGRIVEFMRHLLTRPEARELVSEEAFMGMLISEIVELSDNVGKELYPEIKAAFAEDRVDRQFISLSSIQESFGIVGEEKDTESVKEPSVELICRGCGRTRRHHVEHITVDMGTLKAESDPKEARYSAFIMDREIVCPKCGARDNYQVAPFTQMALTLQLANPSLFSEMESDAEGMPVPRQPTLQAFTAMAFGRPMNPLEAIARYRQLIAQNPEDAELPLRLGGLFRVLYRYEDALACLAQAYALAPEDPDVLVTRAMAEHDFGDKAIARELYAQAQARLSVLPGGDPDLDSLRVSVITGLKNLQKGRPSPWKLDRADDDDDRPETERPGMLSRFTSWMGGGGQRGKDKPAGTKGQAKSAAKAKKEKEKQKQKAKQARKQRKANKKRR